MPGSVAALDTAGVQVPWYFRCPISLELMRDPVTVCTGQTYDRNSIESWVATGNTTCPVTRSPLADFTLIPNHTLRRLIQEWCVAHRSLGVERIPTPKQPADPDLVRLLLSQGGLPALRKLRALARDSDKNRLVMATPETRAALLDMAFGSPDQPELQAEAMAVLAMLGLGEAEAAEVVGREERLRHLGSVLAGGVPLEARVNAGAIVEAAAAASGSEGRAAIGAAEGVIAGLVALVEEKANARAARVGVRGLFALCLAKENRPRAVAAGAAAALARRLAAPEAPGYGDPERALAALELLCRGDGGRDAVVAGAGGGAAAVAALVRAMSGRAAEHAAGALVAVVGGSEALQKEAVKAGAMNQLLLMVQGGCSDRAKRKAQLLLKLLRSAWPAADSIVNSDDFLQPF